MLLSTELFVLTSAFTDTHGKFRTEHSSVMARRLNRKTRFFSSGPCGQTLNAVSLQTGAIDVALPFHLHLSSFLFLLHLHSQTLLVPPRKLTL